VLRRIFGPKRKGQMADGKCTRKYYDDEIRRMRYSGHRACIVRNFFIRKP
jgi:hypothetical protein